MERRRMKESNQCWRRMVIIALTALLLVCVEDPSGNVLAQESQGPSGTFNRDYFWAVNQTDYWRGLATSDVVTNHIKPAANNLARGDYMRAKADIEFVLLRFVNHPQALLLAGILSRANKDYAWGIKSFERALGLYPQYALTHAQYGKFLVDMGELNGGIARLKHALEMDPKLRAGYEWLAAAYVKDGKPELAQETREQARSLGLDMKSDQP
jgi:Tfp pilus assembly protein PilF